MISKLTKNQKKRIVKHVTIDNKTHTLFINIRHDDRCGNGHNTTSVTGSLYSLKYKAEPSSEAHLVTCGCIHDIILEHAPELAYIVKWHLCSTDAPLHYIANTCYHASNRDCDGLLKGEPNKKHDKTTLFFDDVPLSHELPAAFVEWLQGLNSFDTLQVEAEAHPYNVDTYGYKYTFKGYKGKPVGTYSRAWYRCPFDSESKAQEYLQALQNNNPTFKTAHTMWGKGKERDLEAARESCKLDITDEQLKAPRKELAAFLTGKLTTINKQHKEAVEKAGFVW